MEPVVIVVAGMGGDGAFGGGHVDEAGRAVGVADDEGRTWRAESPRTVAGSSSVRLPATTRSST